jgi:hypothetical protein
MDDPMFARWTCDGPPPLPLLGREVAAGLTPVVARQLGWVLRSWGIALPGGGR